jgi:hypothetical protein
VVFLTGANLGLMQSHSFLCFAVYSKCQDAIGQKKAISRLYWISPEIHIKETERRDRFTPTCLIFEQRSQPSAQPQVRLSLLHSISLKIGAHGLLRTTLCVLIPPTVELLVQKYKE